MFVSAVLFLDYATYLLQNSNANLARVQTALAQRQNELAKTEEGTAEAECLKTKLQSEIVSTKLEAERANDEA